MTFLAALLFVTAAHLGAPAVADLPDACSLLDRGDLAAVQGDSYTSTRLTTSANISRCFYQLPSFTASVSLDIIEDQDETFWETYLEESSSEERGRRSKSEGKKEKEEIGPMHVSGVGDEAFWLGNVAGATLWVRKGELVLRLSVGGTGSQPDKLERSKQLAIRALEKIERRSLGGLPDAAPDHRRTRP